MTHVKNPITGEVRYVTQAWARWLKLYGWQPATFDEFMAYAMKRLTAPLFAPPLRLHDH